MLKPDADAERVVARRPPGIHRLRLALLAETPGHLDHIGLAQLTPEEGDFGVSHDHLDDGCVDSFVRHHDQRVLSDLSS